MREKDIQTVFKKNNAVIGVFELKLCKSLSIPFEAVKPHQVDALLAVKSKTGLYYKISDSFVIDRTRGVRFPSKKPFDCFYLAGIPAFVVICFYIPRERKSFYYIPIQEFLKLKKQSKKKSITEAEIPIIYRIDY